MNCLILTNDCKYSPIKSIEKLRIFGNFSAIFVWKLGCIFLALSFENVLPRKMADSINQVVMYIEIMGRETAQAAFFVLKDALENLDIEQLGFSYKIFSGNMIFMSFFLIAKLPTSKLVSLTSQ